MSSSTTRIRGGAAGTSSSHLCGGAGGDTPHQPPQLVEITRLREEGIARSFEELLLLAAQHIAGEEDHALTQRRNPAPELRVQRLTVHSRHLGVRDDDLVSALLEHFQRHRAIRRDVDLMAVLRDCPAMTPPTSGSSSTTNTSFEAMRGNASSSVDWAALRGGMTTGSS